MNSPKLAFQNATENFLQKFDVYNEPPMKVTIVADDKTDIDNLPLAFTANAMINLLTKPTGEYPLKNGKTTYYVCKGKACMPPTNDLNELINADKY